jgi:hypothetical protein
MAHCDPSAGALQARCRNVATTPARARRIHRDACIFPQSSSTGRSLSNLPGWLSDALCRLASGGSFALRQLYTDADEVLFQAARPTILNGIEDVIRRQDLADRAIFLTMGFLPQQRRRPWCPR